MIYDIKDYNESMCCGGTSNPEVQEGGSGTSGAERGDDARAEACGRGVIFAATSTGTITMSVIPPFAIFCVLYFCVGNNGDTLLFLAAPKSSGQTGRQI